MATDAQRRAIAKYDKQNTVTYGMKMNKKTDADIIARFTEVGNVQGYVKRLVREDISADKMRTSLFCGQVADM